MNTYTNIYLFLFLSFFSCGKGNDAQDKERKDEFITFMSDKPYLGSAKSRLYLHGYEGLPSVEGTGSLSIANVSGDSVTLALICELSSGDGFRFGLPGKQLGKQWTAVSSTGTFAIREN
ncbi:hypothetical protein [Sphingobacterium deserti]|uniref:Uncharacterized protein n=1 Tax=Sphingobacterium deserti TaxID=1229276 RepID=A0A0B8T3I0_9SPHI|nr:hypothetical protein [Sphingobacterium deserti]KGE13623.1 hypothetical protein DI53_2544 [Sphingobacterium deserti]